MATTCGAWDAEAVRIQRIAGSKLKKTLRAIG
jgi:hypothetical protein